MADVSTTTAVPPEDQATIKAMEVAKMLSKTLAGGGVGKTANQSTMLVPSDKIGLIIGKGGATIKDIEASTNVKLQLELEATGEPQRNMYVTGSLDCIDKAKTMIQELIDGTTFRRRGSRLNPTKTIQIPNEQVGLVIGRGGSNIRKICMDTACRLKIESEDQAKENENPLPVKGCQNLHIMGTPEAAANAERAVIALIQNEYAHTGGYGPHQQQVYQLREQPYALEPVHLLQVYNPLLQHYPNTASIAQQLCGSVTNAYPGVSYGYPPQQFMCPTQT
jgi:transcription antitermination factor NusA-like protein